MIALEVFAAFGIAVCVGVLILGFVLGMREQ